MTLSPESRLKRFSFDKELKKKPVDRTIAYYADEILDAWLNIGKHAADLKEAAQS